ncbi:MFS transporter [Kitasatospora xanthocidica]|uniref:MFS transporter n=1 Tax=Kitasatospora xanthocidica TaxID=83382 RepID=A0A372ZQB7_9ACTN|nr:MFS transporter [Kitasatospora xanthocidica]RGD57682.1 MFS transporter [Kitasatospora xanthocidica]
MLSVLRNRTYLHLFAAQIVALVGTGLATVALGLLAYDLAGAGAGSVLGTALAIKMLAYVGIAPVVTALAHRIPRRRLMAASDLTRAAVALTLPFVTEVWQVYVLIFVLQSASAAFTPAFQSVIPEVLPEEREYTRALSLSRLAYDTESLVSPVLAGALLALISYNWLFWGTAAGFLASAALVLSAVLPKPLRPEPLRSVQEGAGDGVLARSVRGTRLFLAVPRLRAMLALDLAAAAASAMVIVNTVVYVRGQLGRPATDVPIALGAYGAGSMAVALLLPRVLDRVPDRIVMLPAAFGIVGLFALLAVLTAAGPGAWRWPVLLAVWAVLGAAGSLILTPTGRVLRDSVAAEDLPAVFSAQFSLSHGCWLLTYPLAGWLGATLGLTAASAALGAVALASGLLAARAWRGVPGAAAAATAAASGKRGVAVTR